MASREQQVYLFATDAGYYKIGRAAYPAGRVRDFAGLPFAVWLDHVIDTVAPVRLERVLHQHFAQRRVRAEWFRLIDSDVAVIKLINRCDVPEVLSLPPLGVTCEAFATKTAS
jgi:hypothetical protein